MACERRLWSVACEVHGIEGPLLMREAWARFLAFSLSGSCPWHAEGV